MTKDSMRFGKVSVVMATRNDGPTIKGAIFSVLSQTYGNLELIIIDDHSTDNSLGTITEIKDTRIKVICNDRQLGPGLSRNQGIRAATGDWLAVIDGDDLWTPNRLEHLLSSQAKYGKPCIVSDSILEVNLDNLTSTCLWKDIFKDGSKRKEVWLHDYILRKRNAAFPLIPMSLLLEKTLLYPDIIIGEDLYFYTMIVSKNRIPILVDKTPCYVYQRTGGRLTSNPMRMELYLHAIMCCIKDLPLNKCEKAAFSKKLELVKEDLKYQQMKTHLRHGEYIRATGTLMKRPKNVITLVRKILQKH